MVQRKAIAKLNAVSCRVHLEEGNAHSRLSGPSYLELFRRKSDGIPPDSVTIEQSQQTWMRNK
jgi:hypothetical protein